MALSKITAASITSNVLSSALIADGEITFADIANNTITGAKIASATITGDKIGLTAITSNLIVSGVTLTSPVLASANLITALTLAGAAGNSGQVLTSAGSGLPTWSTPTGGAQGFVTQYQGPSAAPMMNSFSIALI
jgi:2',3'-cyclic-nucleotide 2'-phosphodiesterase (5'-nucleotidase family)